MNLQKMLNKGRIDCFKMADQSYFETQKNAYNSRQRYSIDEGNPSLTDNFYGAQFALIAEYYLKGILLPVLEITIPDDDEKIKRIASQLTDEQKYKILSSDSSVISELQQLYGNTGISGKKIVSKLGKESLQTYGHDLNVLITKIIEKAEQGKFKDAYVRELEEKYKEAKNVDELKESFDLYRKTAFGNQTKDENIKSVVSDSYIKSVFTKLLNKTSDENVKKAFPEGRYGHLNGYVADIEVLEKLVRDIRSYVIDISAGIEIVLDETEGCLPLDKRIEFPKDLKYVTISDSYHNISRVFEWDGNKLSLKYGIEEQDKRNLEHYTANFLEGNRIFLKAGEKIQFFYENDETKTYFTRNGKIEKDTINPHVQPFNERKPQYFSQIFGKSAVNVERKLTEEVVKGGYMQSELGKKYARYYNSAMRVLELGGISTRYKFPRQKNSILHRMLHKERIEPMRRDSNEFREAYTQYLGSKFSYRFERGKQIFLEMMSYVKKGNLKSECFTALKDAFRETRTEDLEER